MIKTICTIAATAGTIFAFSLFDGMYLQCLLIFASGFAFSGIILMESK